jgi:hypothetical protein
MAIDQVNAAIHKTETVCGAHNSIRLEVKDITARNLYVFDAFKIPGPGISQL